MSPQEFCYWLQGFFELGGGAEGLTKEQAEAVKDHLKLVFQKVTPERLATPPAFVPLPYPAPTPPTVVDTPRWARPGVTCSAGGLSRLADQSYC